MWVVIKTGGSDLVRAYGACVPTELQHAIDEVNRI
jgi:hypothetical protein